MHLQRLGFTSGYGHFQAPEEHFQQLKALLETIDHRNRSPTMGTGPNWRIRVLRTGLRELGIGAESILFHGVQREVFALPVADNALPFLRGEDDSPAFHRRRSIDEISQLARARWMVPRARRQPEYKKVSRQSTIDNLFADWEERRHRVAWCRGLCCPYDGLAAQRSMVFSQFRTWTSRKVAMIMTFRSFGNGRRVQR